MNGWWITGFADGECFLGLTNNGRNKDGFRYIGDFRFKQREDDRFVLEQMQSYFGFGRLHNAMSDKHPQTIFVVNKKVDLLKLVRHFDKFPLQSKKRFEYPVWKEAIIELQNSPPNWEKLRLLKKRLEAIRRYKA